MEHVFVGGFEKVLVFTSFYTLYLLLLSMYCFYSGPFFIFSFSPLLFLLLDIPSSFFLSFFLMTGGRFLVIFSLASGVSWNWAGGLGKRKMGAGLYSIVITLLILDIGHYFCSFSSFLFLVSFLFLRAAGVGERIAVIGLEGTPT